MESSGAEKRPLRAVVAFAVAPLLPILLLIHYMGRVLPFLALVYAYATALVVGVPTYLLMRRAKATQLKHFLLYGFLAFGLLTFAFSVKSYWEMERVSLGDVDFVEGGRLTAAGWLRCIYYGVQNGLYAALGGAIFWGMTYWKVFSRTAGRLALALPIGVFFVVANALTFRSIDWSGYDPEEFGCHSGPMGRTMHPSIDLHIKNSEWPELTAMFEQVAKDFRISYRNSSESRPGVVELLYLSMCMDSAFRVSIGEQRWARNNYENFVTGRGVSIAFYAAQDNEEWKAVAKKLLAALEARWGNRVRFIDGSGYVIAKPDDLFSQAGSGATETADE